jgi:L,D-transpeptidase catalytic domain/Putative peptidoglycan binding domain
VLIRAFICSLLAFLSVGAAAPNASPPPKVIARGVRVSGVRVGGLTAEPARARIRKAFGRSLRFHFQGKHWGAAPTELGATTSAESAVMRALTTPAGGHVRLHVKINAKKLRAYIAGLDHRLSRPAQDASVVGLTSSYRPIIADGKPGLQVDRARMAARITRALKHQQRKPLALAANWVQPSVTASNFGPVIVIKRNSHVLQLYNGSSTWRTFSVATGQPAYPTPVGNFDIVDMQMNPWWRPPPNAPWAAGAKPIPPGPGNPLGTRWMGLSAPGVGIHATPDDASIGYSASHGCIRMHLADAEWLFGQVHVGTPVFIVDA